jgi:D-beta-D-heptose 7-phosphate kinase/D-beta-D-heptose 1-phosphate adenosyltransferase
MTQPLTFCDTQILVVGDIMLDVYKYGIASRISPEAPVPVVKISRESTNAGGAANVAANLRGLDCRVTLVGYIGDDDVGHQLRAKLSQHNIDHENLIQSITPTISKTRVLADGQHIIRYDYDSEIDTPSHRKLYEATLIKRLTELGQQRSFNVIVVSDYAKGTITDEVMQVIKSSFSCPIVCDIKQINSELFHNVFCITPNLVEAQQLVELKDMDTLPNIAHAIKQKFSLEAVIITMSHDGIFLLDQDDQSYVFPAYVSINQDDPCGRLDVTGAGDTVLSTLAACISNDYSLLQSVKISNLAAGIVVGKIGTAVCHIKELQNAYLQL